MTHNYSLTVLTYHTLSTHNFVAHVRQTIWLYRPNALVHDYYGTPGDRQHSRFVDTLDNVLFELYVSELNLHIHLILKILHFLHHKRHTARDLRQPAFILHYFYF